MRLRRLLIALAPIIAANEALGASVGTEPEPASPAATFLNPDWPARTLSANELAEALGEEWDKDYAVMLMASWCRYCRQFKPIWHEVNRFFASKKVKNVEVKSATWDGWMLNVAFWT